MALQPLSIQDLVPNRVGSFQQGMAMTAQARDERANREALAQQQQLAGRVAQGLTGAAPVNLQERAQLLATNPELVTKMLEGAGVFNERGRQDLANIAFDIQSVPAGEARNQKILQAAKIAEERGGNPEPFITLLNMPPEIQEDRIQTMQLAALSPEQRVEFQKGPELTATQKNVIAAGFPLGTPEHEAMMLRTLMKPQTSLNVSLGQEGEERKGIAKVQAGRFEDILNKGEAAKRTLSQLDQLDAIDVQTGALEPAKVQIARVASAFGVDASGIANVANAESFNAVSGRLVQDILSAATGPQTDQDAARASKTISALGDDPRAAKFKSDSLRALSLRDIERAQFIDNRVGEGETFTKANADWNRFIERTPNLSSVVKNPSTGLPLFFYQFKQIAKRNKPDATDNEIAAAWRQANGK